MVGRAGSRLAAWLAPVRAGLCRVPMSVTISGATILAVVLWGWLDPFGLRARLDNLVLDQYLRFRSVGAAPEAYLQCELDDGAAREFGRTMGRHILADIIDVLHRMGSRLIVADLTLEDAQDMSPPADWLADRALLRPTTQPGAAPALPTSDELLERAIARAGNCILAFKVGTTTHGATDPDEPLVARAQELLSKDLTLRSPDLAARMGISLDQAGLVFDPALDRALRHRLVRLLGRRPNATRAEAVERIVGQHAASVAYLRETLEQIFPEEKGRVLVARRAAFHKEPDARGPTPRIEAPRPAFAGAAFGLGYVNAKIDADNVLRRLPVVQRIGGRDYLHQCALAALRSMDVDLEHVRWQPGSDLVYLDADGDEQRIPVDAHGQLRVNWPISVENPWQRRLARVSLRDVYALSKYEADIRRAEERIYSRYGRVGRFVGGVEVGRRVDDIHHARRDGNRARVEALRPALDRAVTKGILKSMAYRMHSRRTPEQIAAIEDPIQRRLMQDLVGLRKYHTDPTLETRDRKDLTGLYEEYWTEREKLAQRVCGKICFIGDTRTGSVDLKPTPVAPAVPGMSVQLMLSANVRDGSFLSETGTVAALLVALAIGAILCVAFASTKAWLSALIAGATVVVLFSGGYEMAQRDVLFSPVAGMVTVVLCYSSLTTYRWVSEYRQRRFMRSAFEAHTSPRVVDAIVSMSPDEIFTPRKRRITVFLAQLEDYEELAATVGPDRLPGLLGQFFNEVRQVIIEHEGTFDRYQGYALLAFFNAPVPLRDHAHAACRAALACRNRLAVLRQQWGAEGLPDARVSFGLHTGDLLVGNITLTSKVDYTVAGEQLNVAYRLADLNDTYHTDICLSEATWSEAMDLTEVRELDSVRIKGKAQAIRAFELLGAKGKVTSEEVVAAQEFGQALQAFREKKFTEARVLFEKLAERRPDDGPASVYLTRCETRIEAGARVSRREAQARQRAGPVSAGTTGREKRPGQRGPSAPTVGPEETERVTRDASSAPTVVPPGDRRASEPPSAPTVEPTVEPTAAERATQDFTPDAPDQPPAPTPDQDPE